MLIHSVLHFPMASFKWRTRDQFILSAWGSQLLYDVGYIFFMLPQSIHLFLPDEHFRWRVRSALAMLTQIKLNHSCLLNYLIPRIVGRCLSKSWQEANTYLRGFTLPFISSNMATAFVHVYVYSISFKRSKHSDDFDRQMTSICPSLTATTRLSGLIMLITILLRNDNLLNGCWESCLQWRLCVIPSWPHCLSSCGYQKYRAGADSVLPFHKCVKICKFHRQNLATQFYF